MCHGELKPFYIRGLGFKSVNLSLTSQASITF